MLGFTLEFKKWYLVLRGPKGRVYSAIGFSNKMPVFLPDRTVTLDEYIQERDDELVFTNMKTGEELFRF